MTVLGRAYINVHADMRPFKDDLERQSRDSAQQFEKSIGRALTRLINQTARNTGQMLGSQVGDGFNDGFGRTAGRKDKSPFVGLVASLAAALDDGISALPMEVKAALVTGIIAASPVIAGALSAAITAGVGLGVAGIGIALSSQFETVQRQATLTFRHIRTIAVTAAGAFEEATLRALLMLETRFEAMSGRLTNIFDMSADFVAPFTDAILDTLDILAKAIENTLTMAGPFVEELGNSFRTLGLAIGYALEILASTGEDGSSALRDLTFLVAGLVVGAAGLLRLLTQVHGAIRQIANAIHEMPFLLQILTPPLALFGLFASASDDTAENVQQLGNANQNLQTTTTGVVVQTEAEIRALKELSDTLSKAADATLDSIQANVDFERSLDNIEESLQRNGKTLDVNTEKGRKNVESFIKGLRDATEAAKARVATGELSQEQALALYDQEIARLKTVAREAGITESQFSALFGQAVEFNRMSIAPDITGLDMAGASAEELARWLRESIALAKHLSTTFIGGALAGARVPRFAHGGIVDTPILGMIGESGPEVVVPLTKPARAAQLARDSGLSQILGMGETQVMVFIGDEQLEARMVRVVQGNNRQQALAMAQGTRRF